MLFSYYCICSMLHWIVDPLNLNKQLTHYWLWLRSKFLIALIFLLLSLNIVYICEWADYLGRKWLHSINRQKVKFLFWNVIPSSVGLESWIFNYVHYGIHLEARFGRGFWCFLCRFVEHKIFTGWCCRRSTHVVRKISMFCNARLTMIGMDKLTFQSGQTKE